MEMRSWAHWIIQLVIRPTPKRGVVNELRRTEAFVCHAGPFVSPLRLVCMNMARSGGLRAPTGLDQNLIHAQLELERMLPWACDCRDQS